MPWRLLRRSQLARFHDQSSARGVHGAGLLDKGVLARLDGGHQVLRAEVRRGRENHVVDVGDRQKLPVGVEAGEAAVVRDFDAELLELTW